MVLDSLISSHALPIQGFYCHSSAASSSLSTWRQPQSDNSMEMGVSRTHQDNSLHMRPAERERQHPPQVKVEENAESEEELRTIQDNTDSENEDYNQIGEARRGGVSDSVNSFALRLYSTNRLRAPPVGLPCRQTSRASVRTCRLECSIIL